MDKQVYVEIPGRIKMPILGYGTWQCEGNDLEIALEAALDAGYRHIDTAAMYKNEEIIGRVINRWIALDKLKREDIFITTKLPPSGMRPQGVEHFLKTSLEKLQLNYVDLYLIHLPFGLNFRGEELFPFTEEGIIDMDMETDHISIWKTMEEMVDRGWTKAIGLSNFNRKQIESVLACARIPPANLQIEMHIFNQQVDLVKFCKRNGISLTSYSTFTNPGTGTFLDRFGVKAYLPDLFSEPVVKRIALKHGKNPAQVILRHMIQKGIAVIPKSIKPSRVRENSDVFDLELDWKDMKDLNDQYPPIRILDNSFQRYQESS